MKPFIETRMFTDAEQITSIQPNETDDGLVLFTSEVDGTAENRLYLTFEEVDALCKSLQQMKDHVKDGK
jgi:hypothetical protein